jgi:ATP-dependent helicase/nuclease subunit B
MYDWLAETLEDDALVVTANRRLATVLTEDYSRRQLEAGCKAWRTPAVRSWPDWLRELVAAAHPSKPLPARLNGHQSRVLWERCLRQEISSPLLNIGAVVSQARDTWTLIHDYCLTLDEVERAARGRDQGVFVRAARRYQGSLAAGGWIDDAGLSSLAVQLIRAGDTEVPGRLVLAGFDRQTPAAARLIDALRASGCQVENTVANKGSAQRSVKAYENPDAEMRAAGAWARRLLTENPERSVAIVATHLERDAERCARLVREGFAPGWQLGGRSYRMAVNVSYGRRFGEFPVIATALLALRWLQEDIGSLELSRLLRSQSLGAGEQGGRSRMELELRRWPDMRWSPRRALQVLSGDAHSRSDWLQSVAGLEGMRGDLRGSRRPSEWAASFDAALQALNWPGETALDSVEYQLHNRWRELLNEFARLDLVIASMSLGEALARLRTLVGETIFQPENRVGLVQLLGPLEAAGMEFDDLLVCGLTSSNWPPPGRPAALLSRELQRDHKMPDADPDDTLAYARRVLLRLADSSSNFACSYALSDGDAEQRPSGLLPELGPLQEGLTDDPGWHAVALYSADSLVTVKTDPAPPVGADESVTGGTSTVNYQLSDPFAAFAYGRLGIRPIPRVTTGLPPNIRGNIIHRALNALYHERPSQAMIQSSIALGFDARLPEVLRYAFAWLESRADPVLGQLLELEKARVVNLLRRVMELDLQRDVFEIIELEAPAALEAGRVKLDLRIDRIDRLETGEIAIIDYKTGTRRQFLLADGAPADGQLVAYTMAVDERVGELAYFNIDSRQVDYTGAGRELTPDVDWDSELAAWQDELRTALREFEQGDVRVNGAMAAKDTRSFGLLNRVRELQRGQ